MSVFNNISDLYKLQKEAREMKKKMELQKIVGESKNGMVKLYMNGAQELEDVYIKNEWFENIDAEEMKKCIKEAYRDYTKKLQKTMMGSIDMDQIKNMLGK